LLSLGAENKEIAKAIGINVKTVQTYLQQLEHLTGKSRRELVVYAVERRLKKIDNGLNCV
jgi:DNA-binding CsgD family transcriptional regulator